MYNRCERRIVGIMRVDESVVLNLAERSEDCVNLSLMLVGTSKKIIQEVKIFSSRIFQNEVKRSAA